MAGRRRILFGHKPDWEDGIRAGLDEADEAVFAGPNWGLREERDFDWRDFDLVVPLRLAEVRWLARAGPPLEGKVVHPSLPAIELCADKHRFARAASLTSARAMIPRLIEAGEPVRFPCILKKKDDEFGVNSFILHAEADLARFGERVASADYFLQDYVAGREEHATHLLLRHGRIVHSFNVTYDMGEMPVVNGKRHRPLVMTTGGDDRFLDAFAEILAVAGFTDGTCCIDYRIVGGVPQVFEVNPRFGWSLLYDIRNYLRAYEIAARA